MCVCVCVCVLPIRRHITPIPNAYLRYIGYKGPFCVSYNYVTYV